jgi:hypothetical protein
MTDDLMPETLCPHGLPLYWGGDGDRVVPVGALGEPCPSCATPFAEMRGALERIRDMTGDARIRRIASEVLQDR